MAGVAYVSNLKKIERENGERPVSVVQGKLAACARKGGEAWKMLVYKYNTVNKYL